MKISTRGRYALRLMIDLAQNKEQGNISLKDVAKRQEISIKYLEQIATPLIRAGLIKALEVPKVDILLQEILINIQQKIF